MSLNLMPDLSLERLYVTIPQAPLPGLTQNARITKEQNSNAKSIQWGFWAKFHSPSFDL